MSSPKRVQQGLDVLKNQLTKNAPKYFNTETREGRAALLAALIIAGGEYTKHLPKAVHDPNSLYNYSEVGPRGWAQFTKDHHVFNSSVTPQEYDRYVGRILHGEIALPRGKGRFPIRDFANRLENGELRTREDIMRYLREKIHPNDWQAIHLPSAEVNIFTNEVIKYAYRIIYGCELGQPAPVQRPKTTQMPRGSETTATLGSLNEYIKSQTTQATPQQAQVGNYELEPV